MAWVLAGLWILDGLFQLQPGMFTTAMIQTIMQPILASQPQWLFHLLNWAIYVLSLNIVVSNACIAAIQLAIGAALFWRADRHWPYWASLAWAVLLWVFGQALGGLLAGQASVLTGAPGSAIGYALLTWAAWPQARDADAAPRRRWIGIALGLIWAVGAGLQAAPGFFAPSGLSGAILGVAGGQPAWLAHLLNWGAAVVGAVPGWSNAGAVALMALSALGMWIGGPVRRPALALSMVMATLAWVFGQGFGMIFTGMGTDPNTAPLLCVLGVYAWGRTSEPQAASVPERQAVRNGTSRPWTA